MPWRLALLVVVVLAPAAQACDLKGEHPGPGVFWIYAADGELLHRIEVPQRGLDADCSLYNPRSLEGDRFAWISGGDVIKVLNITTGSVASHEVPGFEGRTFTLAGDQVLVPVTDAEVIDGEVEIDFTVWAHHLGTGAKQRLAVPFEREWSDVEGPVGAWRYTDEDDVSWVASPDGKGHDDLGDRSTRPTRVLR